MSADQRSTAAIALGVAGLVACTGLIVLRRAPRAVDRAAVRDVAVGAAVSPAATCRCASKREGRVRSESSRAFNTMAEALEEGRSELQEQNERLKHSPSS